MDKRLHNVRIAVLATDGFEESELLRPVRAYRSEGASVSVIAPKSGHIKSWKHKDWGMDVQVDVELSRARPADYDALMLPGGVLNPDRLRMDPKAVAFVKAFVDEGKPIAAICHGPQTLIETGATRGRTLTSWPSLKTDLINAGANWVDMEVVVDGNLITSRGPDDIPTFNERSIAEFSMVTHPAFD